MSTASRLPLELPLGLSIRDPLAGTDLRAAIVTAGHLGVDRVEIDWRLIERMLGAPVPAVPLEDVPENAMALGLLELEEEVFRDAYLLAHQSLEQQLHAWRVSAPLGALASLRRTAQAAGVGIDVISIAGLASWPAASLDFIGRAASALGARVVSVKAPPANAARLAGTMRHQDVRTALVFDSASDPRQIRRALDADAALLAALDFTTVATGALPVTPPLSSDAAARLSHCWIGPPGAGALQVIEAWRRVAESRPAFIVPAESTQPWARAAAEAVACWRDAIIR